MNYYWNLILIALATEFLDGFLARTFSWDSLIGRFLDPVADKLFFFSVGLTWLFKGPLTWTHLLMLSTREVGIFLIVLIFLFQGKASLLRPVQAHFFGKLTTVLQYLNFFVILWDGEIILPILAITAFTGLLATLQYTMVLRNPQLVWD